MRTTVRQNKKECTGCGACVSICPKGAICMEPDDEGFLYPRVDAALCVACDACEKRCPAGRQPEEQDMRCYGAQHVDASIREQSSSGGVFTALAGHILRSGGVVFGAVFDDRMRVEHIGAFHEEECAGMRGSKYVQSDAADAIEHAASLLARGIPVLFSGTPCQISGLKARVGTRYDDQLLTVDFVCHGVPSPGVFAAYLSMLEQEHGCRIVHYTFRDKRRGWKDFSVAAVFEDGTEHVGSQRDEPFLYGFLQNLYLRPSCAQCSFLRGNRHESDITLADLWGAQSLCPQQDDDSGLSLLMINTPRGQAAIDACQDKLAAFPVQITQDLLKANPSIEMPARAHKKREAFFRRYKLKGFDRAYVMKLLAPPGLAERIVCRIAHLPIGLCRRVRLLIGRSSS